MKVEFNGTYFIIGRSAEENWNIIANADKTHYWIHAKNIPSSHIIIETDEPLESEIQYACALCKTQTKIRDPSVKYSSTQVKNIKFGSKSGEVYFGDTSKVNTVKLLI